jgi:TetR/AcrR family transcriptional regulator, transcriptional repressor for nem operon
MSVPKPAAAEATRSRVLDIAERLVQTRGFNGFSYADIAAEVGISKASLHYHFPTKAELGRMLVVRYTQLFAAALQQISSSAADGAAQLRAYVKLYADVLVERRMCLCGMVAAEYATLPPPMQEALRLFFEFNEGWLARVLEQGSHEGSLRLAVPAAAMARMLVGALEGEMLVARTYGDPERFAAAARLLLAQLDGRQRNRSAARVPAGVRRTPGHTRSVTSRGAATQRARRG